MGYAGLLGVGEWQSHSFLITLASPSPFLASKPQQDKNTLRGTVMQIFSNTQEGILQYRGSTTRRVNTVMLLLLVDHQVGL